MSAPGRSPLPEPIFALYQTPTIEVLTDLGTQNSRAFKRKNRRLALPAAACFAAALFVALLWDSNPEPAPASAAPAPTRTQPDSSRRIDPISALPSPGALEINKQSSEPDLQRTKSKTSLRSSPQKTAPGVTPPELDSQDQKQRLLAQRFLASRSAELRHNSSRRAILERLNTLNLETEQGLAQLDSQPQLRDALNDLLSSGRDPRAELARLEAQEKLDPQPAKPRDDAVDRADVQLQLKLQPTHRGALARVQVLIDLARFPGPTGLVALLRYDPSLRYHRAQPGSVASATHKTLSVTERAPGQALIHLTGSTEPLSYGCIAELDFDVDLRAPNVSELALTEVLVEGLPEASISARAATLALLVSAESGALPE